MTIQLDRETLDRLRAMPPRVAFEQARSAVWGLGDAGSEDFLDLYEQLVDADVLTWEQIRRFE